jgi:hypothetical protein
MDNLLSRTVTEIPEESRRSLEDLLGRQLRAGQRIFIMVLEPSVSRGDAQRAAAAAGLRDIMVEARAHADREGVTEEQIDAAVEESMAQVRRRLAS